MLQRHTHTQTRTRTTDLSRRSHSQRRLRRAAASRLFCSTNGCTTFLIPADDGRSANCPVCGLERRMRPAPQPTPAPAH